MLPREDIFDKNTAKCYTRHTPMPNYCYAAVPDTDSSIFSFYLTPILFHCNLVHYLRTLDLNQAETVLILTRPSCVDVHHIHHDNRVVVVKPAINE